MDAIDSGELSCAHRQPPSSRNLATPLLHHRRDHHDHDNRRDNNKRKANRSRDENRGVALCHQHGAAQVLLHHRAEHEAEQQRRRREAELRPYETEYAEQRREGRDRITLARALKDPLLPLLARYFQPDALD